MSSKFLFVLLTAPAFAQQAAKPLPAGDVQALVQSACTTCHPITMITGAGHTAEDWKLVVERMVSAGAEIPKDKMAAVTTYLAKNFPEGNVPPAKIIPGTVKISFKEWTAPTVGSRPHDPLATHDGYLWYTGQYASVLGRVDMKTGEIKEFRPTVSGSGPHGLTEDKDGDIWFTANSKGYIGKLDPKTGEIKLVDSPTKGSLPYGMVVDSKGTPYYCEFGAPKIAAIDPQTMAIKEWTLPNPEARPRRIAITNDDMIYYADYSRGYLGRLDPKTGSVKDWPSPGGP